MTNEAFKIEEQPRVAQDPVGEFIGELEKEGITVDKEVVKDFDLPDLTVAQKAESMWAVFNDLKRKRREQLRRRASLGSSVRIKDEGKRKEKEDEPLKDHEAVVQLQILATLYKDEKVKEMYLEANVEHLRENAGINGDRERYQSLVRRVKEQEEIFDSSLKDIFGNRGRNVPEYKKLLFEVNSRRLDKTRTELEGLLERNPKLRALAQYEYVKDLSEGIREAGFGQTPSRRKLFEKIEDTVATTSKPILLSGGSGTGKTQMAETLSQEFTGQTVNKVICNERTNIESLVAKRAVTKIDGVETVYYEYGPLGQALTGKKSTLDKVPSNNGGVVLADEFNLLPEQTQLAIIAFVEKCKPGKTINIPVADVEEVVAHNFIFVAAINPTGGRFQSGRNPLPEAVARKFDEIPVDYVSQTPDEPEIYELMLAALTDENGRMVGTKEELSPEYEYLEKQRKVSSENGEKTQNIKERVLVNTVNVGGVERPVGGFLWRFAQVIGEINKSISDKETVLKSKGRAQYMDKLVIDIGEVVNWLKAYEKIGKSDTLEHFIMTKVHEKFLDHSIKKFSEEDKKLARDFFEYFGIEIDPKKIAVKKKEEKIMTPINMGILSPRVKYLEIVSEESTPTESYFLDKDGNRIEYDIKPAIFDGVTYIPGSVVRGENGQQEVYLGIVRGTTDTWVTKPYVEKMSEGKNHPHTPESSSITEAREILQDRVFGLEEVKQAFGTHIDSPPDIPYTREKLEKAKEEGMDLILYTDKLPDGKPITGKSLSEHLGMKKKDGTDLLYKENTWYTNQPFFTDESIKSPEGKTTYWKLVKREVIPGSTSQNYLDQTITLSNYIKSLYDDPSQIPANIQQALTEFDNLLTKDPDFRNKVTNEDEAIWKPAAKTLANLQITKLFRESFIELLYRLALTDRIKVNTAIQLLESMYSWTKSLTSDGRLVYAGDFDRAGLNVSWVRPDYSSPAIGCSFSAVFL